MRGNKSLASKLLAKSVHPDSCPVRKKKEKTLEYQYVEYALQQDAPALLF